MLHQQEGCPVAAVCQVLQLPRSTYYHRARQADESELREAIERILGEFPTYGSRRVTMQLRRSPHEIKVNRKHVQRVMREMQVQQPVKCHKRRTTNSQHPYPRYPNLVKGLEITHPDQMWVSDITYIHLQHEFIYLAVIMDVYTRAIRGWNLGRSLDQELALTALRRALDAGYVPTIHHSDQGVQYAAHAYIDLLTDHQVRVSMAGTGKPEENGYAERLMRTIKAHSTNYPSQSKNFTHRRNDYSCRSTASLLQSDIAFVGHRGPARFRKVLPDTI